MLKNNLDENHFGCIDPPEGFMPSWVSVADDSQKFILVMRKNIYHYKTINGKKKRIHRHIMEEHLGRTLEENEHVYHLDGNSSNNHIDNLVVITKKSRKHQH